jgi:hypothetical protein
VYVYDRALVLCRASDQAHSTEPASLNPLQVPPRVLNSMVSSAKGLEELLSLAEKHGHGFDAIHVSTCLNRWAARVFRQGFRNRPV